MQGQPAGQREAAAKSLAAAGVTVRVGVRATAAGPSQSGAPAPAAALTLTSTPAGSDQATIKTTEEYDVVRGLIRTSTRPTLTLLVLPRILRASVWECTLKVTHAPILVECLFSLTLLRGVLGRWSARGGAGLMAVRQERTEQNSHGRNPAGWGPRARLRRR